MTTAAIFFHFSSLYNQPSHAIFVLVLRPVLLTVSMAQILNISQGLLRMFLIHFGFAVTAHLERPEFVSPSDFPELFTL